MWIEENNKLVKHFSFKDFISAFSFLSKVALISEKLDHHPEIILEWGKVTVTWWSHKIKGLHSNDFICASKTDLVFKEFQ